MSNYKKIKTNPSLEKFVDVSKSIATVNGLLSNLEKEITKSRVDSINIIKQIIAQIPNIVDQLTAKYPHENTAQAFLTQEKEILLLSVDIQNPNYSNKDLKIYLIASENNPDSSNAKAFYQSNDHKVCFIADYKKLFKNFSKQSRTYKISSLERILDDEDVKFTFIHELQHAKDSNGMANLQHMFELDRLFKMMDARSKTYISELESNNDAISDFIKESKAIPNSLLKQDCLHYNKIYNNNFQDYKKYASRLPIFLEDVIQANSNIPKNDAFAKQWLSSPDKIIALGNMILPQIYRQATFYGESYKIPPVDEYTNPSLTKQFQNPALSALLNITEISLAGKVLHKVLDQLSSKIFTYMKECFVPIDHANNKFSVSSISNLAFSLEVRAYRTADCDIPIALACTDTPFNKGYCLYGTSMLTFTKSDFEHFLDFDLPYSMLVKHIYQNLLDSKTGFIQQQINTSIQEIAKSIIGNPNNQFIGTIFEIHPTAPTSVQIQNFVKNRSQDLFHPIVCAATEFLIQQYVLELLHQSVFVRAYSNLIRAATVNALKNHFSTIPEYQSTTKLYERLYDISKQIKQPLLNSLSFQEKNIDLPRILTATSSPFSVSKMSIAITRKIADLKIIRQASTNSSSKKNDKIFGIVPSQIQLLTTQINDQIDILNTFHNTLLSLFNILSQEYIQKSDDQQTARNFVNDQLQFLASARKTIVGIFIDVEENGILWLSNPLTNYSKKIEAIANVFYKNLVETVFTHTDYQGYIYQDSEIGTTLVKKAIINAQKINLQSFVEVIQDLLLDIGTTYQSHKCPKIVVDVTTSKSNSANAKMCITAYFEDLFYFLKFAEKIPEPSRINISISIVSFVLFFAETQKYIIQNIK